MATFIADIIVAIHLSYVSFVVLGQLLILVGIILKWQWIRNVAFRVVHMLMICVVAVEAIFQFECPLTTWEGYFRKQAGQKVAGSFIGRCLDGILFCDWPDAVFTAIYIGFALLVIATFVAAPPRRRPKISPAPAIHLGH